MLGLSIVTMLTSLFLGGMSSKDIDNAGFYAETMAIIEVNTEDEIISCMSFNGNVWEFEDTCGDWEIGDVCSVLMCDNGTEIVTDDIIMSVKYSGWVNSWGYDINSHKPLIEF